MFIRRTIILVAITYSIVAICADDNSANDDITTALMQSTFKIWSPESQGTGFIIGKPTKANPERAWYVLVTASHVIEPIKGQTATLVMRKRDKDAKWTRQEIQIPNRCAAGTSLWTKHPTQDVVAMYLNIPDEVNAPEPLVITTSLMDDERYKYLEVQPGQEALCLGYPFGAEGNPAGFPILRRGVISSYPLTPVRETKTFLFDFQVFGGNSGGPVYFIKNISVGKAGLRVGNMYGVLGLVIQQENVPEIVKSLNETKQIDHPLGLAVVLNACYIRELLDSMPEPTEPPKAKDDPKK